MFLHTAMRTLGEVGYHLTLGALVDRDRTRAFNAELLAFRQRQRVDGSLLPADLDTLFPGIDRVSVQLERFQHRFANVYPQELLVIASICAWLQPRQIFEIGTFDGNTTLQMALNSPPDCRIHTLALPPDRPAPPGALGAVEQEVFASVPVGERFQGHAAATKITQHLGNSAAFDFSPYGGAVDLVFIDGSHEYGYVAQDTRNALCCCSERGVILWHDFSPGWPGVVRAVRELSTEVPVVRIPGTMLALCRPNGCRAAATRSAGPHAAVGAGGRRSAAAIAALS